MGNFRQRIQRFMYGRYGTYGQDKLNRFLLITSFVAIILSWIFGIFSSSFGGLFLVIAVFSLGYSYFRMLSKNYAKRSAENTMYLKMTYKIRGVISKYKKMWSQRNTHKFYKCPGCRQQIRVPKGRGRIQITCPKCRTIFEKTT